MLVFPLYLSITYTPSSLEAAQSQENNNSPLANPSSSSPNSSPFESSLSPFVTSSPTSSPVPAVSPSVSSSSSSFPVATLTPSPTPNPSFSVFPFPSSSSSFPVATLTPSPTPNPSSSASPSTLFGSQNLATIPNGWTLRPYDLSQYVFVDDEVLFDGQSTLRVEPDYDLPSNGIEQNDRAVYATGGNYGWFSCRRGDHIYFSVWIKTSSSSYGYDGLDTKGARIGIDFYDSERVVYSLPLHAAGSYVPWGTSAWTQLKIEVVVPSSMRIEGFMPWLQVMDYTDTGNAWYANSELYVQSNR